MRQSDKDEVLASDGWQPAEALWGSLEQSDFAATFMVDGEPLAIFGVVPARDDLLGPVERGIVWMLTGEGVERHRILFARVSRVVVADIAAKYGCLLNMVDARYGAALRWAKWVGFTVGDPMPFGRDGRPFCPIELRR